MPHVTSSVLINSGPEPIWALVSDPARYPEFVGATEKMLDVPGGELEVGYTYREYGGIEPFFSESTWTVASYEAMSHQSHLGDDGKMRMFLEIDLEPAGDATRLTFVFGLKPRWFLAAPLAAMWALSLRKRTQGVIDASAEAAKSIIEAEAGN